MDPDCNSGRVQLHMMSMTGAFLQRIDAFAADEKFLPGKKEDTPQVTSKLWQDTPACAVCIQTLC